MLSTRIRFLTAGVLLLAIAACDSSAPPAEYDAPAEGLARIGIAQTDSIASAASQPDQSSPEAAAQGEAGALLAYRYDMGISAPASRVKGLVAAHENACRQAGPQTCQILGSSTRQWGEDQISGSLNLRATPDWLAAFRASIAKDAKNVGGRITADTVQAEDLTRLIIDVEARLEAKKTLRERIRALLATSEGSLADVLAAERALSDVQGEIDAMTAQLKAARARVDMSTLHISYASDPKTSGGAFRPLTRAFGDFGRASIQSIADAVTFIAKAWPFFILLLVALTIMRFWWRRRK